ncbi:alpha-ribazole phosphatase [Haloimpatiens sp. FM7330]|uniref:alpha-ribazole phosphatase n=1 Tax=Haloimpatiens sp. FM7330 TaxID=3298610 RepID=UPI0036259593
MNIYFLRHGQTSENTKSVYYGSLDVNLNEKGIQQIKKAAKFFKNIKIDKVYISDRKRTFQTASIIIGNKKDIPIIVDNRLNETNFGDFEGKNYDELVKLYPEECKKWIEDWKTFRPVNGETFIEMYTRTSGFMDDIKNSKDENILVVTHSGVIRAALCYVMDANMDLFWKFGCINGDRVTIKYEYENFYIDSITHCD